MQVSIITINYNNLEGLKRTIDSVLSQTWRDFEWILIDGGSTDGSKEVIEELAKNPDANISYWCSEKDKGVYNAMNKGIAKAQGEYLNFMNSGDCFAFRNTLELVFNEIVKEDVVFGYMMRKTIDGWPHNIPSMKDHIYWEDFYFDTLPHQSSYIRRELFDKYGGYDESYPRLADWKWFLNAIVCNRVTTKFIHHKLSVYECGGISEDDHWKEDLGRLRDEFYPKYLSERELRLMRDLHLVLESKIPRVLFRIARRIAYKIKNRRTEKEFHKVRYRDRNGQI